MHSQNKVYEVKFYVICIMYILLYSTDSKPLASGLSTYMQNVCFEKGMLCTLYLASIQSLFIYFYLFIKAYSTSAEGL